MKIDDLKKIAEENDYEYFGVKDDCYNFRRESDGALISISFSELNKILFLDIDWCEERDFEMIKASIEFTGTPIEDRGER